MFKNVSMDMIYKMKIENICTFCVLFSLNMLTDICITDISCAEMIVKLGSIFGKKDNTELGMSILCHLPKGCKLRGSEAVNILIRTLNMYCDNKPTEDKGVI